MLYKSLLFKLVVLLILPSWLEVLGSPGPLQVLDNIIKWFQEKISDSKTPKPSKPLMVEDTSKINYGVGLRFEGDTPIAVCRRMEEKKSFTPCAYPMMELRNKGYLLEKKHHDYRVEKKFTDGFLQYANDPKYVFCQRKYVLLEVKPLSERLEDKLRRGYNATLPLPSEINNFKRNAAYKETFNPLLEDINSKAMKLNAFIIEALTKLIDVSLESERVKYIALMTAIKCSIGGLIQSIIAFQSNPEVIASGQSYGMTKLRINLPKNRDQINSMVTDITGSGNTSDFEIALVKLYILASECESVKEYKAFDTINTIACTPLRNPLLMHFMLSKV